MTTSTNDDRPDARTDWEERIGKRSGGDGDADAPRLAPPTGLRAETGRSQVTLTWESVPGAVGYQVHVASTADGELTPLDHGGGDVLAVPHPPYVDTTGTPGQARWYAVSTLSDVAVQGPVGDRVTATPADGGSAGVTVAVDAAGDLGELARPWRPMIGSEHLSHALSTERTGGREIGAELTAALRAAHDELGVRTVRAHGILCDDVGVYREVDGEPVHDFAGVDRVYDHILSLGLTPVVELSFMPRDLASDPSKTVFGYQAVVSPPKDWDRWYDLIRAFVAHLVDRYGLTRVRDEWSFEVWNEANLEVFWSGTTEEFFRLYDVTAAAVRSVHSELLVGGPSSAASGWVEELLAHCDESKAPIDFLTTHTYGSPPLDLRPALERHGRAGTPIWWTEWGVTPTHFNPVNDGVFAGVFLLRGMVSSMDRIEALSYWVVSDHFEELGRPPALLHGGFGLRTVGELRKPRWWALTMLERLDGTRVPVTPRGDGAGSLVEALATRGSSGPDAPVSVLVWNLTLDQGKADGSAALDRTVAVEVTGLLPDTAYDLVHHRVDTEHSNVVATWHRVRREGQEWPDEQQWEQLRAADRLEELEPAGTVCAGDDGTVRVDFALPMPGISLLTLTPHRDA
ncbi:MAG: glycosyl hydrolase [Actinocatenispora sp.]